MSIPLVDQTAEPLADIVWRKMANDSRYNLFTDYKQALLDAGWIDMEDGTLPQTHQTVTGVPTNGQTLIVGTITYVFRTVLSSGPTIPNEILRGGSAIVQAQNIFDAVTDNETYEGTTYSIGTVAHPNVDATLDAAVITYTGKAQSDAGLAFSGTATTFTYNPGAYLANATNSFRSARTSQGMEMCIQLRDPGTAAYMEIRPGPGNGTGWCEWWWKVAYGGASQAEFVGTQYNVYYLIPGSGTTGDHMYGVLRVPPWMEPGIITGITVDAAAAITGATNVSPIVIASAGHGLANGEEVYNAGIGGNTAANGTFTVTYVDTDHFSLNGSIGNGDYTTGGTWIRTAAVLVHLAGHGFTVDSPIGIDGARGILVDGEWSVVAVDANYFRLADSMAVASGTYDATHSAVAGQSDLASASYFGAASCVAGLFHWNNPRFSGAYGWYSSNYYSEDIYGDVWIHVNGVGGWDSASPANGAMSFTFTFTPAAATLPRKWWGTKFWLYEACVAFPKGLIAAGEPQGVGSLYNTAILGVGGALPVESKFYDNNGQRWIKYGGTNAALYLDLIVRIPDTYN